MLWLLKRINCLNESYRFTFILIKDLGQSPIQSAQILRACGLDNA